MTHHRTSLLVIDDEPDNLRVVVRHLEAYSFEILTARDGETGLKRAGLALPDLILLDVAMPGIDGYETCRRLKAAPATADIPVLFLTAHSEANYKLRGFEAGGVDYVTKPIEAAELLARVRAHLQIRELQKSLRRQNEELERRVAERTAALERELREREHLLELVRWQSEQLRGLGQRLLSEAPSEPPTQRAAQDPLLRLSTREYEVLQLLAEGKQGKEIASALGVARTTVSTYRARILEKLEVEDTASLLSLAFRREPIPWKGPA